MKTESLPKALFSLGLFTGVAYIIVGIAGGIWPGHWDDTGATDQIFGSRSGSEEGSSSLRSPTASALALAGATLVSVGAILGALPIFWTLVPLILTLVLIVLSVMYVRRARVRASARDPSGSPRRCLPTTRRRGEAHDGGAG